MGGVTWAEYVTLREKPENRGVRMTYDGRTGLLELEMPGEPHETISRLISAFVLAFCEERNVLGRTTGSTTWAREGLLRGLEGDETFYLTRFDEIRGREVDLDAGDPPPDLAVEVDVTHPSVPKLPIYAGLGVPEVWTWAGGTITVRRLGADGRYAAVGASRELPGIPLRAAEGLLARWADAATTELTAEFRAAVRAAGDG